jgi:hypothetical protein
MVAIQQLVKITGDGCAVYAITDGVQVKQVSIGSGNQQCKVYLPS